MEQRSLDQIAKTARIARADDFAWATRRRRLERLASLLETTKAPVRLFTTLECYPKRERLAMRQEGSPLALAYNNASFREEGLTGDSVGEGVAFFRLSTWETHALLCDCGYGGVTRIGAPVNDLIAKYARRIAAKRSFAEWRQLLSELLHRPAHA